MITNKEPALLSYNLLKLKKYCFIFILKIQHINKYKANIELFATNNVTYRYVNWKILDINLHTFHN